MSTNYVAGDSRNINLVIAGATAGSPVQKVDVMGTALEAADATTNEVVVDVSPVATYKHSVRNVVTYAANIEDTFAAVAIGKTVYYDASSTMPATVKLSLSAQDKDGGTNKKFGKVVGGADATATAKTALLVEIIQDRT